MHFLIKLAEQAMVCTEQLPLKAIVPGNPVEAVTGGRLVKLRVMSPPLCEVARKFG